MENKSSSFVDFYFHARQAGDNRSVEERESVDSDKQPWLAYNPSLRSYSRYFDSVLPGPLKDILREKKDQLDQVFTMDVMGQGGFYKDVPIDGEVALTLTDFRTEENKLWDQYNNMAVAQGNILKGKTWSEVERFMKKNEEEMNGGFDLIICRPILGWNTVVPLDYPFASTEDILNHSVKMEQLLINKLYRLLSPQDGLLVMQLYGSGNYSDWSKLLQKSGIDMTRNHFKMSIIKSSKSPQSLPLLSRKDKPF